MTQTNTKEEFIDLYCSCTDLDRDYIEKMFNWAWKIGYKDGWDDCKSEKEVNN